MTKSLKLVYAGTPDFAVPALQAILDSPHQLLAVYTQPDRPAGRGRHLHASPVKELAIHNAIPLQQPTSLNNDEQQSILHAYQPDLMIVAAYGLLLPPEILAIPKMGCINIHASLLPRWRGAAPIQHAILAGDIETGITIMQMDEGLDTGDMLMQDSVAIQPEMNAQQLHDVLAELGAALLLKSLDGLQAGVLSAVKQNTNKASYAKKILKQDAVLDWSLAADLLARQVRAFNPWPIAYTQFIRNNKAEILRVWEAVVLSQNVDLPPGTVLSTSKSGIDVATGQGVLRLMHVQRSGSKPLPVTEFINACDVEGQRLG